MTFDEKYKAVNFLKRKVETGNMTRALATMKTNFIEVIKQVQDVASQVSASMHEQSGSIQEMAVASENLSNLAMTQQESISRVRV